MCQIPFHVNQMHRHFWQDQILRTFWYEPDDSVDALDRTKYLLICVCMCVCSFIRVLVHVFNGKGHMC